MTTDYILQTQHLKKVYGDLHAVEDVSLKVGRGLVYGFLGPNGAGKTTTIGMLLGLLHPSAGTVTLFGQPVTPGKNLPLRKVGALVGAPALVPYLSARANLELLARLTPGLPAGRLDQVLEQVGLSEAADRPAGRFSTGMKQRLGLAMALLHAPELLILDEPTNGMDPAGMREVRNLLRELTAKNVTIFLSSHLLHEIEQVADRVTVLNRGRVVAEGEVASLIGDPSVVRVRIENPAEAARELQELSGARDIQPNGSYLTVSGVSGQAIISHLVQRGRVPSEVTPVQSDLESMFLELTGTPEK